jgi:SM-20-related protein
MLNLAALQGSSMARDPFEYVIVDDFVPVAAAPSVSVDFPKIPTTGSFPLSEISYGPAFAELVAELNGPGFERGIANLFGLDLSPYARVITVRGRVGSHDGGVHTDAAWKIISVLLYLNEQWTDQGGRLRLLRGEDVNQTAVEIVPKWGTLLAFRRSDRSWHGHLPAEGERRVVQVNWVTSQQMADKELRRHRRSAWLKRLLRPSTRSGRPEPEAKGSVGGRRPA